MPIRMTGMFSNMDTDSLVESLVKAQRLKNKSTSDKKTKLEWKQDKWADLNKKLYDLYNSEVSKLRMQTSYLTKKTTTSNSSAVNIKANANSPEGSHQIEVTQLASSQYVTGSKITDANFSGSTLLTSQGFTAGSSVINIKHGDKSVELAVTSTTTVDDFLSSCKSVGLSANYDANQKRMFISSSKSGEENAFSITTGSFTVEGANARQNIDNLVDTSNSDTRNEVNTALSSLINGDASAQASAETKLISLAKSKVNNEATKKATDFYTEVAKKEILNNSEKMDSIRKSCESIEDAEERQKAVDKKVEEAVNELVDSTKYQDKIKSSVKNGLSETTIQAELGTADPDEMSKYSFEGKTSRELEAESNMKSALATYKTVASSGDQVATGASNSALKNLGLGEITGGKSDLTAEETGGFTFIAAKNSKVIYNGVEIEDSSNTVSVNGLTLEVTGITDNPVTCNISKDTETTYNMIKDFVKKYNEILKEMNSLYYANNPKGYDPLSDDEKEKMTDDQIEKWETKIKDSILRRDPTLGALSSAMKNALQSSVEVDGKKYSLAAFGVATSSDYTEYGLLHIYGDEDDATMSGKTNKLKEALDENPELVMNVFTGVAKELYSTMKDKMKKTSLSSALTFYNDKDIKNQIDTLDKKIKKQESALTDLEDKYYKQFSAMETAMAKLQSQQNSLAGLLG